MFVKSCQVLALPFACLFLNCGGGGGDGSTPAPTYPAPNFLTSPTDQYVALGGAATFNSVATGQAPLQYQWFANRKAIPEAVSATYVIPAVTLANDGTVYQNEVLDAYGFGFSLTATLHVTVNLATIPLAGIQVAMPDAPALLPGQALPLVITATPLSGPLLLTAGRGGGPVAWSNYLLTPSLVTVDGSGIVSLPADPRASDGLAPQLLASVVGQPAFTGSLAIPIRYDGAFLADASGAQGPAGSDGSPGMPGLSGGAGSCDPDSSSAGGDGSDGSGGGPGSDGGAGLPGSAIQAWVTLHPGAATLLEVRVTFNNQSTYFLIDPKGGSLRLTCDGGAGGSGGAGGQGGAGGSGGFGCPNGSDGMSGSNGPSGSDGPGGNGGTITVTVDPSAQPYLGALQFSNQGGAGGGVAGPAAVIQVAAVAPLW